MLFILLTRRYCPAALLLEIVATYSPEGSVPHSLLGYAGTLLLISGLPGAQRCEVAEESLGPCCRPAQDFIAVVGCVGLGISLYLIHIYVTPLKRFVQASSAGHRFGIALSFCLAHLHQVHLLCCVQGLYGAGFLGGLGLALTQARTQYLVICKMLCQACCCAITPCQTYRVPAA